MRGGAAYDSFRWQKSTDTLTPTVQGITIHGKNAPLQICWKNFMKKKKLKKENEILKQKLTEERVLWHNQMTKQKKRAEDTLAIAIETNGTYRRLIAYLLSSDELTICEDVLRDCKIPTIERLYPDKIHVYMPKD